MIINYNDFLLEKKDNRGKIKKFINIPDIYNYAHRKSPKFSIWIASQFKNKLINELDLSKKDENNLLNNYKEFIEKSNDDLKIKIIKTISSIKNDWQDKLSLILDWLKSPLREGEINLTELNFDEALEKAEQFHDELKATGSPIENETGDIIMEFSDGYYWIDLETNYSKEEGEAMGHCGRTSSDTLISLRDSKKRPHITGALDYDGTLTQMRGKENTKPIQKYHKYIVELLKYPNVDEDFVKINKDSNWNKNENGNQVKIRNFNYEYNPEDNFHISELEKEEIINIINNNKNIKLTFSIMMSLPSEIYSLEDIAEKWEDLKVKDNELWVKFNEWNDLKIFYESGRYSLSQQTIIDILNFDIMDYGDLSGYDIDIFYQYIWDDLLEKTKKQIVEDIIKIGEEFEYKGKEIKITKNNISKDYNNVIIDGEEIPLKDILEENKNSNISNILYRTYSEAQNVADLLEARNDILKTIKKELGEIKIDDGIIYLNVSDFEDDIKNWENYCEEKSTDYKSFLEFICYSIEEAEKEIPIYEPRYGWSGDINPEHFHEGYLNLSEIEINESDEIRKDQRLRFDFISKPDITAPGYSSTASRKRSPSFTGAFDKKVKYQVDGQPKVNNKKGKNKNKEEKKKQRIKSYKKYFKIDQDDWKRNLSARKGEYWAGPGKAWI